MRIALVTAALFLMPAAPAFAQGGDTVVLDPGHGGYDSGIITSGTKEKDMAFMTAQRVAAVLKGKGKKVYLTRKVDRRLTIDERVERTGKHNPDVFLSLHASGSDGFSIYVSWYPDTELSIKQYYSLPLRQRPFVRQSAALAASLREVFIEEFGAPVTLRQMPLPLLNSIGSAAAVIEAPAEGLDYGKDFVRLVYAITIGLSRYENGL